MIDCANVSTTKDIPSQNQNMERIQRQPPLFTETLMLFVENWPHRLLGADTPMGWPIGRLTRQVTH